MRVALTADVHLHPDHPERLQSFAALLAELESRGVRLLVAAGDLFDQGSAGHGELDALLRRHPRLLLLAFPGNHDQRLRPALFSARNIQVFTRPTLKRLEGRAFLFLPYQEGRSMGAAVEESGLAEQLPAGQWFLISHGDYGRPRPEQSGGEGGYFPLTRQDLARLRPARAILGHIHLPGDPTATAVAPGSPYPLSAAERGPRRVLLLETDTAGLEELPLSHTPVYLEARLLLVPDGREPEQVHAALAGFLDGLGGGLASIRERLRLLVCLQGYTTSRQGLEEAVGSLLSGRGVHLEGIDLERLEASSDTARAVIAERVRQAVASLSLPSAYPGMEGLREEVLARALRLVCRE